MSAPVLTSELVAPGWEAELGRLLVQVPDLPPAARQAVAQVVLSVLAEDVLDPAAAASAVALLDELQPGRQRADAARRHAAALRDEARALTAQAAVQRRRSHRLAQARRVCS